MFKKGKAQNNLTVTKNSLCTNEEVITKLDKNSGNTGKEINCSVRSTNRDYTKMTKSKSSSVEMCRTGNISIVKRCWPKSAPVWY